MHRSLARRCVEWNHCKLSTYGVGTETMGINAIMVVGGTNTLGKQS